jgi:Secretion system C-terminal sorting domain
MTKITLLALAFLLNFCFSKTYAAEFRVNSAASGTVSWHNASTWVITSGTDADGIPDADDIVFIHANSTSNVTVTLNAPTECSSLDVRNSLVLNGQNLTVTGSLSGGGISGVGNITAGEMNINFNGGINTTGNVVVTGDFTLEGSNGIGGTGTMTVGGMTRFERINSFDLTSVKFISAKELIMNGGGQFNYGGISISNGGKIVNAANQTFTLQPLVSIGGILFLNAGLFLGGTLQNDGNLVVNHAVGTVGNLSFQPNNLINNGLITVKSGRTFNLNSVIYSGTGNIHLEATSNLALTNSFNFQGITFTNNGTVSNAALVFSGSSQQTLAGNGTIHNLTVDNNQNLVITGIQSIDNTLTFTNGKIQLSTTDLTVGTTITGANSNRYVQTNSTGNLKRTVTSSSNEVLFPVGESNYTPVTIESTSGGNHVYSVRVSDGIDVSHPLSGTQFIKKEWDISRSPSGGSANARLKFEWNAPTDEGVGFDLATAQLLHHNGTVWEALPFANRRALNDVNSLTQNNVTNFSPFTVGLPSVVLPIELLSFKATDKKQFIQLHWQTAEESNASHFDIERSVDGRVFEKIGQTKTKGSDSNYQFDDQNTPLSNVLFYRLKMVDTNGKFKFSKVQTVERGKGLSVSIFPNPVSSELTIDLSSELKNPYVEVFDVLGRSVFAQNTEGGKILTINTLSWVKGIHFLRITDGQKVFQEKILKQ